MYDTILGSNVSFHVKDACRQKAVLPEMMLRIPDPEKPKPRIPKRSPRNLANLMTKPPFCIKRTRTEMTEQPSLPCLEVHAGSLQRCPRAQAMAASGICSVEERCKVLADRAFMWSTIGPKPCLDASIQACTLHNSPVCVDVQSP